MGLSSTNGVHGSGSQLSLSKHTATHPSCGAVAVTGLPGASHLASDHDRNIQEPTATNHSSNQPLIQPTSAPTASAKDSIGWRRCLCNSANGCAATCCVSTWLGGMPEATRSGQEPSGPGPIDQLGSMLCNERKRQNAYAEDDHLI